MTDLVLLTNNFPFFGGEQFLETEINFWENSSFENIYIIPRKCDGKSLEIDKRFNVLKGKRAFNVFSFFKPFFIRAFFNELFFILKNKKINHWYSCIKTAIITIYVVLREYDYIYSVLDGISSRKNTVVYSYWNDCASYAAILLKRNGYVSKVVTRVHGFDIYQERRPCNYMPLKRQFVNDYDRIYVLSASARDYYSKNYNASESIITISPLGVRIPSFENKSIEKNNGVLKILSLSYCVPVKQIHLILRAVELLSEINKNLSIHWVHIGDGPLLDTLRRKAKIICDMNVNLSVEFTGYKDNREIYNYLSLNYFDVFINTSSSEGMPVSIMEAMAHGVPVIAPRVGGIPELVSGKVGYLMPQLFSIEDIIIGLNHVQNNAEAKKLRENAQILIKEKFNSETNYPFIKSDIEILAGY